ncbi:hypothetical protein EMCRGX_G002116 [Ephydatia muelleri]
MEEELQIIETEDDDYCDNTSVPRAEIAWTEAAGRPGFSSLDSTISPSTAVSTSTILNDSAWSEGPSKHLLRPSPAITSATVA